MADISIPENLKYDSLLVILGGLLIGSGGYSIFSLSLFAIGASSICMGMILFFYGAEHMRTAYLQEAQLRKLAMGKEQSDLLQQLKSLGLITQRSYDSYLFSLKQRLER